jgi:putative membrane protein
MYLSQDQSRQLDTAIRGLEKNTGIELVAAVVGKCDHYPEIPWKAFALGAAFSTLAVLAQVLLRPDWLSSSSALVQAVIVLGVGTLMALLTMAWPGWARCFLDKTRSESEMRQYAQSLFLEHHLFATTNRTGILLLVGLFERRVVILPDRDLDARLPSGMLQAVIEAMRPALRRGDRFQALSRGVSAMMENLLAAGFKAATEDVDQIPDTLIQQKGKDDG